MCHFEPTLQSSSLGWCISLYLSEDVDTMNDTSLAYLQHAAVENAKWISRVFTASTIAGTVILLKLNGVQTFVWAVSAFTSQMPGSSLRFCR
jgi:hypothetical protein